MDAALGVLFLLFLLFIAIPFGYAILINPWFWKAVAVVGLIMGFFTFVLPAHADARDFRPAENMDCTTSNGQLIYIRHNVVTVTRSAQEFGEGLKKGNAWRYTYQADRDLPYTFHVRYDKKRYSMLSLEQGFARKSTRDFVGKFYFRWTKAKAQTVGAYCDIVL